MLHNLQRNGGNVLQKAAAGVTAVAGGVAVHAGTGGAIAGGASTLVTTVAGIGTAIAASPALPIIGGAVAGAALASAIINSLDK